MCVLNHCELVLAVWPICLSRSLCGVLWHKMLHSLAFPLPWRSVCTNSCITPLDTVLFCVVVILPVRPWRVYAEGYEVLTNSLGVSVKILGLNILQ